MNARAAAIARDYLARARLAEDAVYRVKLARDSPHERPHYRQHLPDASLSVKECEVLQLAANGLRNKDIAAALGVSINTVGTHFRNTYGKLQVEASEPRTLAVATAIRRGLITGATPREYAAGSPDGAGPAYLPGGASP